MLTLTDDELLDTAQIAELLRVTRPYVTDKLTKRPGFPQPAVNASRRLRRWRRREVERFLAQAGA